MRNMSFALTTGPVLAQSKDVTRRLGWLHAKPGELIQPVLKGMGLKPGEKIQRIGGPVRVLSVRREPLELMKHSPDYGYRETMREGFPGMSPAEFIAMFCRTHKPCTPAFTITRIEFSYDLLDGWEPMPTAPKDGSEVELLLRHRSWHYEKPEARHKWQGPHRARWTDFNGGGWTWSGMYGSPIAWRPAA